LINLYLSKNAFTPGIFFYLLFLFYTLFFIFYLYSAGLNTAKRVKCYVALLLIK